MLHNLGWRESMLNARLFFFMVFVGTSALADLMIDPAELKFTKSQWHIKSGDYVGEYYMDVTYKGKVIVHILERFMPTFDCIFLEAREQNGLIVFKSQDSIFLATAKAINSSFSIHVPSHTLVTFEPNAIVLKNSMMNKKSLTINTKGISNTYNINDNLYRRLKTVRIAATSDNKVVQIDFDKLCLKKDWSEQECQDIVTVVPPKIAVSKECVICMHKQANILLKPCNHLSCCDECSKSLSDCAICRKSITSKEKVYF